MRDTEPLLRSTDFPAIQRQTLEILQVNLGYLCNLSCTHCHVNAGPKRTELMSAETVDTVIEFIRHRGIRRLDLTGGAPEMNPHFRSLVSAARALGCEVIDRCNLTILLEPGYEDLAEFLADNKVHVVASLPCYEEANVNEQRGKGVYQSSIEALQKLNSLGYGSDPELVLDLVYNPNGAFLPPAQQMLQADYQSRLKQDHGVVFNELLTITNMPISRFGSVLLAHGEFDDYLRLLKDNFSEGNLAAVMCKQLLSVDWQGRVFDCDFNQMLDWPSRLQQDSIASDRRYHYLSDLMEVALEEQPIVIGEHCYGCTAGQGSSCGGALDS